MWLTPTSAKKPDIPAWQEPCSSPYFFLYSGGRGRKADHSHVSVCQACADLTTSPTPLWAGPREAVQAEAQEESLRNPADLKNSGSEAIWRARLPRASENYLHSWGERGVTARRLVANNPLTSERAKVPRGPRELKTGLRNGTLWTFPCGVPWKEVKPPRETLSMAPDHLLSAGQPEASHPPVG